jgi:hypothetical protein
MARHLKRARAVLRACLIAVVACGCRYGFDSIVRTAAADTDAAAADATAQGCPVVLRPTGPTSSQWELEVPNTGDHFAKVAELVPDDDQTYVASGIDARRDEYAHLAVTLPATATIAGVTVWIRARTDTAPVNLEAAPALTSSGTQAHSDVPVVETYGDFAWTWSLDPHTQQPWTVDGINAMTFGVRKSYSTAMVRVTQVWAIVSCQGL